MQTKKGDSKEYLQKKAFFEKLITLYGRNVAIEVLQDDSIEIYKLHLAKSNKTDGSIKKIIKLAKQRGITIEHHSKEELSRISKNAKQDQGVAIDIASKNYLHAEEILKLDSYKLIALDRVQNPQNLGMIIRSCCAGDIDGVILPKQNSAKISPLVVKASAGTLFRIPIYFCKNLQEILPKLDATIYSLSLDAKTTLWDAKIDKKTVFVLGNESEGISKDVERFCNKKLIIPMNRKVESLNVAITASLIAFAKF